jgi:hypothetical protein
MDVEFVIATFRKTWKNDQRSQELIKKSQNLFGVGQLSFQQRTSHNLWKVAALQIPSVCFSYVRAVECLVLFLLPEKFGAFMMLN